MATKCRPRVTFEGQMSTLKSTIMFFYLTIDQIILQTLYAGCGDWKWGNSPASKTTGSPHRLTSPGHHTNSPHRLTSLAHHTGSPHRLTSPAHLTGSHHRLASPARIVQHTVRWPTSGWIASNVEHVTRPHCIHPYDVTFRNLTRVMLTFIVMVALVRCIHVNLITTQKETLGQFKIDVECRWKI